MSQLYTTYRPASLSRGIGLDSCGAVLAPVVNLSVSVQHPVNVVCRIGIKGAIGQD